MKPYKRIWPYLKRHKKLMFTSIFFLVLNQLLAFAGPLIVRTLMDKYIMGIGATWYEIKEENKYTATFDDRYYILENHLKDYEVLSVITIKVIKSNFLLIQGEVKEGSITYDDNYLYVNEIDSYQYIKLSSKDIMAFYSPLIPFITLFLCLLIVRAVFSIICAFIQRITTDITTIKVLRKLRADAVESLQRKSLAYFEREPAGKTTSRLVNDSDGIPGLYKSTINLIFNAALSFIFAFLGMLLLDYRLALFSLLAAPLIYLWMRVFTKLIRKFALKVSEMSSLIVANINEIINGISILQIFNYQKPTAERFEKLNKSYVDEQMKEVKTNITLGWNMFILLRGIITMAIILYFGWNSFSVGGIVVTAGLIYAYQEYLIKLIDPISSLFTSIGDIQHQAVRTNRFFALVDGELEDDNKEIIPKYKGDISYKNIWFAYQDDDYVLKGISLDIKAGQRIGIAGHTGSGKTTLMNLLLRFNDFKPQDKGLITVDDVDINSYSKRTFRSHIGIILQDPVLFQGTIASNIRFGKEDVTDEQLLEVMDKIGGRKILDKFENGLYQEITRAGLNLSGGEKQIISFARALVHNPSILVMDEATSHIDTETEEAIQNALNVVAKDRTVIIIAHRLSTIKECDNIVILDKGQIVENGTHKLLLAKNGYYANMYRAQLNE